LAVIFAVQNPNVVKVSFLAWETNAPLALALLVAFILGFILGLLILTSGLIKRGLLASKLGKRVKELGGWTQAAKKGMLRVEGKDYIVRDGRN